MSSDGLFQWLLRVSESLGPDLNKGKRSYCQNGPGVQQTPPGPNPTGHLSCSNNDYYIFKQLERIVRIIFRNLLGGVRISAKNPAMPVYHGGDKGHMAHFQFPSPW